MKKKKKKIQYKKNPITKIIFQTTQSTVGWIFKSNYSILSGQIRVYRGFYYTIVPKNYKIRRKGNKLKRWEFFTYKESCRKYEGFYLIAGRFNRIFSCFFFRNWLKSTSNHLICSNTCLIRHAKISVFNTSLPRRWFEFHSIKSYTVYSKEKTVGNYHALLELSF